MRYLVLPLLLLLSGCIGLPDGVTAISGFELDRYLGNWYEIARLDHSFERGLTDIKAEYTMRPDGGVRVRNSGFNAAKGQREMAEGVAYFIDRPDVGRLQVSFFGPFYGAYNIIALDKVGYQYALVAGPDRDYLWILARTPKLEPKILQHLIDKAQALGFATDRLIYDQHPQ